MANVARQPNPVGMQVEDNKKALLLHGGKVSQVVQVQFPKGTRVSDGLLPIPTDNAIACSG